MSYMESQVYFARWGRVEGPDGDYWTEYNGEEDIVEWREGWSARNSAPGYLDCTEWIDPQPTPAGALRELSQSYGVYCEMNVYDLSGKQLGTEAVCLDDNGEDPLTAWASDNGRSIDDVTADYVAAGHNIFGI